MTLTSATSAIVMMASPALISATAQAENAGTWSVWQSQSSFTVARACGNAWVDDQLSRIASLPQNWDGYGADPVDHAQLRIMSNLLAATLPQGAPAGSIVPGADGSLQAEWHLAHASFGLLVEEGEAVSTWFKARTDGSEIERTGYEATSLLQGALLHAMA